MCAIIVICFSLIVSIVDSLLGGQTWLVPVSSPSPWLLRFLSSPSFADREAQKRSLRDNPSLVV